MSASATPPTTVVFDLGGVLVDWDPRHLYRQLFDDEAEMEAFLAGVVTPEWNRELDAGRAWPEAIEALAAAHPEQRERIEAYRRRWPEMLRGEIPGTVGILAELRASGLRLLALSNWSAETYPMAVERFEFLSWFEGVLISGEVGVVKPDARIFTILVERYALDVSATVYVDDQAANVATAAALGFRALRFRDALTLRHDLEALGLLGPGT